MASRGKKPVQRYLTRKPGLKTTRVGGGVEKKKKELLPGAESGGTGRQRGGPCLNGGDKAKERSRRKKGSKTTSAWGRIKNPWWKYGRLCGGSRTGRGTQNVGAIKGGGGFKKPSIT